MHDGLFSLGSLHLATAIISLAAGLAIVSAAKGSVVHRRLGWIYLSSMIALNVTALTLFRLTGRFGPFHAAALVSLCTLLAGLLPVLFRRPQRSWLELHAHFMAWSYIGLIAAFASEIAVRWAQLPIWQASAICTVAVIVAGALLVALRMGRTLEGARGLLDNRRSDVTAHRN